MALREWMFNIVDAGLGDARQGKDVSGFLNVCTAGVVTSPTIHTNERGSVDLTKKNLISLLEITNGWVQFWTASSVTSLDIMFITNTGECGGAKAVSSNFHHLRVDSTYMGMYKLWVPWAWKAATTVQDTGLNIPADLMITDASLFIDIADATETLDVGLLASETGGDEDGFLDGMLLTTAGPLSSDQIITVGGTQDHFLETNGVRGVLLATSVLGANTSDKPGGETRIPHLTDGTATSLTYTHSTSDVGFGFIILTYEKSFGS